MSKKSKSKSNANSKYRKYKNTVFTFMLSDEERVKEVYGAIKDKKYGPETQIRITTIKNVLRGGRVNDLSFILDGKFVVLIEHQSTLSENMPLRMLSYVEKLYNEYIEKEDIYRQKPIPLPFPEFIVLYNGTDEMGETSELRLSDVFIRDPGTQQPINLELVVKVYNINKGYNVEMAKRSPTLDGYETLIAMIRENEKSMDLKTAITKAVEDCISQNILKGFLEIHKKELVNMLVTEWDYDLEKKVLWEEAWEGGMEKGVKKTARAMIAKGMDVNTIAEITELTVDDILRL